MPLPEPEFDSRTYREILDEALARIPAHNPEWTNFNESDPGVTLLQLFAYMSESIIYRANLIPERNRQKFLRLLGVPMQAARAAHGLVGFSNPNGALKAITLDDKRRLFAGDVPFQTLHSLSVLPVESKVYYKSPLPDHRVADVDAIYKELYASFQVEGNELEYYETRRFTTPKAGAVLPVVDVGTQTVDGSLWVALLARPAEKDQIPRVREAIGGTVLTLGVMPALAQGGATLYPRGEKAADTEPGLLFETPNVAGEQAAYRRLKPRTDANLLKQPGVVELTLPAADELGYWDNLDPVESGTGDYPPSLADSEDEERLITWIRIRSPEANTAGDASRQVHIPISWVGINAAEVMQRAEVETEQLPDGTGEPDQSATLSNTPVIKDSVELRVNGERWRRTDDLVAAAPEVPRHSPRFSTAENQSDSKEHNAQDAKVFTVDRESGEIRFGNAFHGMRPPRGAAIQASYYYGGGRDGSVGINAITKGESLGDGIKVANPVPTWGGEEGETVAQAEQRITGFIRNRDRLVSKEDIEDIVKATPGVDLGRRVVLPLVHPDQPSQESFGVVTVLVIPRTDPVQPEAPQPDSLFLQTICEYLFPRRILTTELHIRGPEYVPVWLSLSVEVIQGREAGEVIETVRKAVRAFLSPLHGGFEQTGWPLNKDVETAEIAAAAARVDGVAKVKQTLIGDSGGEVEGVVDIEGLKLPRLMGIEVTTGTAAAIAEIQGTQVSATGAEQIERRSTPVPVIPDQC